MKRIVEEPLVFPIGEKDYTVPPVGIDDGLELASILADPAKHKNATSKRLFRLALGTAWDDMVAGGVSIHLIFRAGYAACTYFMALNSGKTPEEATAAAEAMWETGPDPKALEKWVAEHQATPAPRTAAAGASTASTSGTTTRKASTRSPRPRASRSSKSSTKPA